MRTVRDIKLLENIPILVRAALNVPVENGVVMNDYRLRRALPTIKYLSGRGARVVLIGHLGNGGTETLEPVATALQKLVSGVSFFSETVGERARGAIRAMFPGQILVLENLRRDVREKKNGPEFARELAELADIFVEDSFDTCHRTHSSIVGVPKFLPSYAGLLLEDEMRELGRSLTPKHPALAVIGGMKFNTKEAVLTTLLKTYDHVFVGGALANDFLKASGGWVGKSLVSEVADTANIKKLLANPKLMLPVDSVIENDVILDQGLGTTAALAELAKNAKTILWNGPLGKYEDGFTGATDDFARAIASSGAHSVVGGGGTAAAL